MSSHGKSQLKDAVRALREAEQLVAALAKGADVPITVEDLKASIDEFRAALKTNQDAANALVLAFTRDEVCPQFLFYPWASAKTIWRWRKAEKDPLPWVLLNDQVMIKPTDFFAALHRFGRAKE